MSTLNHERWKVVPKYPRFRISSLGRVAYVFNGRKRIRKIQRSPNGYGIVVLYAAGVRQTVSENRQDAVRHGTWKHGSRHANAKLNEAAVAFIRANNDKFTQAELAKKFSVSQTAIHYVLVGRNWRLTK